MYEDNKTVLFRSQVSPGQGVQIDSAACVFFFQVVHSNVDVSKRHICHRVGVPVGLRASERVCLDFVYVYICVCLVSVACSVREWAEGGALTELVRM